MADPLAMLGGASIPPGVTPEDYASYLQAARRAQLSQALMQSSLSPVQQPQVGGAVRGLYVQPRVGALSAASKLGEALMGRKAADEAIKSEANLGTMLNQAYQPGGQVTSPGIPITAEAPPTDPNSQDVAPLVHRLPGASLEQTAAAAQPTLSPVNSRNPMGLPADVARNLAMNPATMAEYAKMVAGPEAVQLAVRGGQDPGQAARDALAKATEISMRPGSTSRINGQWMTAPDPSRGETYITLPNGQVIAVPIGGSSEIQAQRAGETTAAQQANTPHYEPDPFHPGQMHVVYPPTPPAARAPTPSAQSPAAATPPAGTLPGAASAPSGTGKPSAAPAPPNAAPSAPAARTPNTAPDLEQQKKGAESGQAYADQLAKNATSATEVRRSLSELKNLGAQGGVSVSNPAKLELGSYLIAAGMNPKTVGTMLQTDVGALTAASKQTGSLALDSIHDMTSRGTNFDLATFMRYNPNLNMADPSGFNRVLDFMDKRMQQEVAKHADFAQWSTTTPPNRWAIDHPARWLEQQNSLISQGKANSRPPLESFVRP